MRGNSGKFGNLWIYVFMVRTYVSTGRNRQRFDFVLNGLALSKSKPVWEFPNKN